MKKYNRPSIVCKEMESVNMICESNDNNLYFTSGEVSATAADSKDRLLPTFGSDNASTDEEDW